MNSVEGQNNFESYESNSNFRVHIEPAPQTLTLPRIETEIQSVPVAVDVQPAALKVDIHTYRPMRNGKPIEPYDESVKASQTTIYSIMTQDSRNITPLIGRDFFKSKNAIQARLQYQGSVIRPAALKSGFIPQVYELNRVPFTTVGDIRVTDREAIPIRGIAWAAPAYSIEPLDDSVKRFSQMSGLAKNVLRLRGQMDESILREGSNALGPDLPSAELIELPLKSAVAVLDRGREQERDSDSLDDKDPVFNTDTIMEQSYQLRTRLLAAAQEYAPDLVARLEGAPSLRELYEGLPPIAQFFLEESQVKLAAADRMIGLLKTLPYPIFLQSFTVNSPSRARALDTVSDFITDQTASGFPDLSDPKQLRGILKVALPAWPLPEGPAVRNDMFVNDYLDFQEKVQDRTMRMADLLDVA